MALVWSEYGRNMGAIWKMKNSKKKRLPQRRQEAAYSGLRRPDLRSKTATTRIKRSFNIIDLPHRQSYP